MEKVSHVFVLSLLDIFLELLPVLCSAWQQWLEGDCGAEDGHQLYTVYLNGGNCTAPLWDLHLPPIPLCAGGLRYGTVLCGILNLISKSPYGISSVRRCFGCHLINPQNF